jgi:conjugative relaxase-like TrwC/TraI family protein
MLTISKPLSAGQAQSYHQKEFTAKEQNYWSQRGEIGGEWQGRLLEKFGLAGAAVAAEDFARLGLGQYPETGERLVRQRASYKYADTDGKTIKTMESRAGWDATFSAPKSVSLTALIGGDDRVREAHRESVRTALEHLEYYTTARMGENHMPEATARFVAAKIEHDTARPVDGYAAPQLYSHAVIFNITERDNGQYRALQPQNLFSSQFATAVYQSELTYRLRQLGCEIAAGRSGVPEIKGYTQEYLDASSPRSQQIRDHLDGTGRNGKEAAEIAAHSTRDHKEIHPLGEVMAAHRKLAAEYGNQADAVVRAARERSQHQTPKVNPQQRVRKSVTSSRDKNFEREAVEGERAIVRDALRRGMGEITYTQVRDNLAARLASGEFQTVERQQAPGRQFTTARSIEAEQEIVRRVREGHNQVQPVATGAEAIQIADRHPHFNRAQKIVVEDVLSSPDRIQGIQGWAGLGETTVLAAVRSAVEAQGYELQGFAPTSWAARQPGDTGIEAGTLQGVGDRIQFTAADKHLSVANRDLAVIESISSAGRIAVRLDGNRQIEFNTAEHRHFDHGYAVTSHSAQNLTAERVIVNADTSVHRRTAIRKITDLLLRQLPPRFRQRAWQREKNPSRVSAFASKNAHRARALDGAFRLRPLQEP